MMRVIPLLCLALLLTVKIPKSEPSKPIDCSPENAELALWLALEHLEPTREGNKLTEEDRLRGREDHLVFIRAVHEACGGKP